MISETKTSISRKEHKCDWCGEQILIGEKNVNWSSKDDGEWTYCRVHVECSDAIEREDFGSNDFWSFYEGHRGMTMDEWQTRNEEVEK